MRRAVRALPVRPPRPPLDCDVVFSSLPADVGREAEGCFAAEGYPVISNTSSYRMDAGVPLLVPEVNAAHLALLDGRDGGFIVTNPNCSAVMIALALAPLDRRFGVAAVAATTLHAPSGAGYPGVSALDITDNVLPFIANEEEKIERETQKILGTLRDGAVEPAPFPVSAQCHRVNVQDGHMAAVRVKLARKAALAEVREALASFRGVPQELGLHTAPERPIVVRDEPDRPQPRLDRDAGNGMSVTVGRLLPDSVLDYRFVTLSHNTIRGAGGVHDRLRLQDLRVAHREHDAVRLPDRLDGALVRGGIPDADRRGDGVRLHPVLRGEPVAVAQRERRGPFRLHGGEPRHARDQAPPTGLAQRLPESRRVPEVARGNDDPIRRLPAELLQQLEHDRLLALQPERGDRVEEVDTQALARRQRERQTSVEVAAYQNRARPVGEHLRELPDGDPSLRHDHERRDAGERRVGGERRSGVSGRRAGNRGRAHPPRLGHADGHAAGLEGAGGVVPFVLEEELRDAGPGGDGRAGEERRVALGGAHEGVIGLPADPPP